LQQPIAVFDSGLGGLSVVRALRDALPAEDLVYFGDTARVPYGIKSRRTVVRFAVEDARFLLQFDPKMIVAACNTASAVALDVLERELDVPIVGVVRPGARAAVAQADGRPIAVLGTEATISSNAYVHAIQALRPQAEVVGRACPLFVPLVEEGRAASDPIVRLAAADYLACLRDRVGVVVLGCTHYPLLREAIAEAVGSVAIIESGHETARVVRETLDAAGRLSAPARTGSMRFFASDNPARFRRIGARFLGCDLDDVQLVEFDHPIADIVADAPA
jgi:glutamate racemase